MKTRSVLQSVLVIACFLFATDANAVFRAYLSSGGNDGNPCTLAQPCRLLPAALTAVDPGGEIWILDSANYNAATVTIDRSVSILAVPGAVGSVLSIGAGPAISITAAGLQVALRNLVIARFPGQGTDGVSLTGASTLVIENSLIANMASRGVVVSGTGKVRIANTILRNNPTGVRLEDGASAEISGSQFLGNSSYGITAINITAATTTATVSDTIVSGSSTSIGAGSYATGSVVKVFVTRCTIEDGFYPIVSDTSGTTGATSVLALSATMITKNSYAWYVAGTGAIIRSLVNNHIADNTNGGIGSLTTAALQ